MARPVATMECRLSGFSAESTTSPVSFTGVVQAFIPVPVLYRTLGHSKHRFKSPFQTGRGQAMKSAFVLALCTCLCSSGMPFALRTAQETAGWKTWLDSRAADFSGVVLVARGDTVEIIGSYGLADRASGRKNTADTRFNLGSINKTFTAIAIAQLIQQGRLSLDDTLAKRLPDYPNPGAAAKIRIRDLLTHRSGVAQFMGANFGDGTVADMTKLIAAEPLAFEPGTQQQYSNGGYVVLGRVIEVVSGMSYSAYVSEKIYRPAGMTNTGFLKEGDSHASVALGYFAADAQGRPAMGAPGVGSNPPGPGNPAGGGYSTVTDMFRFALALRNGGLLDARMTDYVLNGTFSGESEPKFGFALREQVVGNRRFIGNGGGAPGVNAEFRFEPKGDYTVVVLANSSPPAATRLLTEILNRLSASEPVTPGAGVGVSPPALEGIWGTTRRFGPTVRGTLEIERADGKWRARVAQLEQAVEARDGRLLFALADGQGSFSGRLGKDNIIRGHWIQPGTVNGSGRFASPLTMRPTGPARWRGQIVPWEDEFTIYLVFNRRPAGSLGAYLRNPDRNLGLFWRLERLEQDGKRVRLVGKQLGRGPERIYGEGEYHAEENRLSTYFGSRSGTFDLTPIPEDTPGFYARGKNPPTYECRPPEASQDGWRVP